MHGTRPYEDPCPKLYRDLRISSNVKGLVYLAFPVPRFQDSKIFQDNNLDLCRALLLCGPTGLPFP